MSWGARYLISTQVAARKPPSLSFKRPYLAKFLFWMKAFMVPSGSSGILTSGYSHGAGAVARRDSSKHSNLVVVRQPPLSRWRVVGVTRWFEASALSFRAFRAARGRVQAGSVLLGLCCRRTRTSGAGAFRGAKGRLYAWRDGSVAPTLPAPARPVLSASNSCCPFVLPLDAVDAPRSAVRLPNKHRPTHKA